MSSAYQELDHVVLLCSDLEKAVSTFERLGFTTTPPGTHGSGLGTSNSTVVFPDRRTYIELLGIIEPTGRNRSRRKELERWGSHIYGIAFKGDAQEAAEVFRRCGILDELVTQFSREVQIGDRTAQARFSVARTLPGAFSGAWVFVCQHHTPDLVWRDDALAHPIGARSLVQILGVSDALARLATNWSPLFPSAAPVAGRLSLRSGATEVRFLSPDFAGAIGHGGPAGRSTRLTTLAIAIDDCDHAASYLACTGVEYWFLPGRRLFIPDTTGLGASLLLIAENQGASARLPVNRNSASD